MHVDTQPSTVPDLVASVLQEFNDLFPEQLPDGLLPSRVVDFSVTMKPGAKPKAHVGQFRMSPRKIIGKIL